MNDFKHLVIEFEKYHQHPINRLRLAMTNTFGYLPLNLYRILTAIS